MGRAFKLNQIGTELDSLEYPVTHKEAVTSLRDVVLQYADGEERFVDVLERSSEDVFMSKDELETEVYNLLPTEAVGEPGQSEGEG